MKILIHTLYKGPVAQIRLLSIFDRLVEKGLLEYDVVTREKKQSFNIDDFKGYDLVLIHRLDSDDTVKLHHALKQAGLKTIYEIDDDLLMLPEDNPTYHAEQQSSIEKAIKAHLDLADHVTVSTERLRDRLRQYNRAITVIHNHLDEGIFSIAEAAPPGDGPIRIGYAGGWTHKADAELLTKALQRLRAEYGDQIELVFFWYLPEEFADKPGVIHYGGVDDLREFAKRLQAAKLHIGLAPLTSSEFNKSKSDEKFIEYASQQIAGVYSDIEAYQHSVIHGETGLLVPSDDPEAWYRAIKSLIEDSALREKIAMKANEWLRQSRLVEHVTEEWWALLNEVVGDDSASRPLLPRKDIKAVDVSIIVHVGDNPDSVKACVNSIRRTMTAIDHEIILVDNGDHEEVVQFAQTYQQPIKYLKYDSDRSWCGGYNFGASHASGKYLLFMHSELEMQVGCPSRLMTTLNTRPEIGAVGPKLVSRYHSVVRQAGYGFTRKANDLVPYPKFMHYPANHAHLDEEAGVAALPADGLMIRSELFADVGGFCEEYSAAWQDVDLGLSLWSHGYSSLYCPEAVIENTNREPIMDYEVLSVDHDLFQSRWADRLPGLLAENGHDPDHCEVSIIILTFNALEYTKECLDSIRLSTVIPYEIVLIDNHSTDGTVEYLQDYASRWQQLKLIENDTNRGFAAGNNQGVALATGEFVMLLNNDVVVAPGWLTNMVAAYAKDPKIGVMGPISNSISGRQYFPDVPYKDSGGFKEFATHILNGNFQQITPRRRIAGFAMLFSKAVYDAIGGLDEEFGSGNYEDDDICMKLRQDGYAVMVHEGILIHHYGSRTFIANKVDYNSSLDRNRKIFENKWPDIDFDWLLEKDEPLGNVLDKSLQEALGLIGQGELAKGRTIFNEVMKENPIALLAHYGMGLACQLESMHAEARQHFEHALSIQPTWIAPIHNLVMIDRAEGDTEQAKLRLVSILERDPSHVDTRRMLGEILLQEEDFTNGVALLKGIIEDNPKEWQTHFILANLYLEIDNIEESRNHLHAVLEVNPDHNEAKLILEQLGN